MKWLRIGLVALVLLLGLSGCFRDAADSSAAPTRQQVDLTDLEQMRSPTPTNTVRPVVPSFTPRPTKQRTLVIGGPPVEDDAATATPQEEEEDEPTPTQTLAPPTATEVPAHIATVAPPSYGDRGITPTATLSPTPSSEPQMPTPTDITQEEDCIYVVQGGDTLFRIAQSYGLFPEDFYADNPELQYAPNDLDVGQEIRIPDCESETDGEEEEATPVEEDASSPEPTVPSGVVTHIVQQGENLYRIALNYGITVQDLVDANSSLANENTTIFPGQELIIPRP